MLRSIGDAVIACDDDGSVVFMNGVAENLTGWSEQEAKRRPLHEIFHIINESTREPVESPADRVRRLGAIVGLANHTVLIRRDGSEVSIDDSGAPIFDASGKLTGIVLIFRDISGRRRAERNLEMLSASGAALASTLDVPTTLKSIAQLCIQSFCDFCYFDLIGPDGVLQRTTRRHRDPAKQEALDRASRSRPSAEDVNHPVMRTMLDSKPILVKQVTEEWLQQTALNEEHNAAIRELKFHSLLSIPLQSGSEQLGVLSFCRTTHPIPFDEEDVRVGEELGRRVSTAIMNGRLYRTLATREESLRLALQAGKIGIWEYHPLTGKLIWSPRCREIFGLGIEDRIDLDRNFELLHPEDRANVEKSMQSAMDPQGTGEYAAEFRIIRPSGELRWVNAKGRAFFEKGSMSTDGVSDLVATRFVGMVLDITEARQTEAIIRKSEARFRALIDNASVGILIGDLDGSITYMNPALLVLLGLSQEDVAAGRVRWDDLTPPEFAERDRKAVHELHETGTCTPYEKAFLSASGQPVPILLGGTMIGAEISGAKPTTNEVAVFVTDLTGLRKTETALRESEKLAAVGRLAGSIAHEINNPLEAVTNLLYLIGNEVSNLPARQLVATAQEELSRVSHIVTHTLRFHRQATRPRETRVESILESVLALYKGRILNADVVVETRYRNARPLVCYEGEIRQVLANLVGNALDASTRGGRLLLREREATDWKSNRKGVMVTIADTGSGMDTETIRDAFKAFFTTKGIGGTGLGLWISEEIIQRHKGRIKVRSSRKHSASGTVFAMFLPYEMV